MLESSHIENLYNFKYIGIDREDTTQNPFMDVHHSNSVVDDAKSMELNKTLEKGMKIKCQKKKF